MYSRFFNRVAAGALLASSLIPAIAQAQGASDNFPSKPVRMMVGFTPGGATDITARVIADKLQLKWGQSVLVENRPGAGGNIAADLVAKSAPDGYTIVLGVTGSHSINTSLYKNLSYHPVRDFEPITQATQYANVIVVHPSLPVNSVQDLLAMARREGGKMPFAHDGTGTGSHLTFELLLSKAGVKMVPVTYKGAAPLIADIAGQQVAVAITGLIGAVPAHKSGRIRILNVTSLNRAAVVPEVPSVAEQGFPGFFGESWSGFFAPKGTPKRIIDKTNADMVAAMRLPDVEKKMADLGTPLVGGTPEEFGAYVAKMVAIWAEAVKVSGVSID